ncbi:unnamed protein product, partial [Pylaiella littoralis]
GDKKEEEEEEEEEEEKYRDDEEAFDFFGTAAVSDKPSAANPVTSPRTAPTDRSEEEQGAERERTPGKGTETSSETGVEVMGMGMVMVMGMGMGMGARSKVKSIGDLASLAAAKEQEGGRFLDCGKRRDYREVDPAATATTTPLPTNPSLYPASGLSGGCAGIAYPRPRFTPSATNSGRDGAMPSESRGGLDPATVGGGGGRGGVGVESLGWSPGVVVGVPKPPAATPLPPESSGASSALPPLVPTTAVGGCDDETNIAASDTAVAGEEGAVVEERGVVPPTVTTATASRVPMATIPADEDDGSAFDVSGEASVVVATGKDVGPPAVAKDGSPRGAAALGHPPPSIFPQSGHSSSTIAPQPATPSSFSPPSGWPASPIVNGSTSSGRGRRRGRDYGPGIPITDVASWTSFGEEGGGGTVFGYHAEGAGGRGGYEAG